MVHCLWNLALHCCDVKHVGTFKSNSMGSNETVRLAYTQFQTKPFWKRNQHHFSAAESTRWRCECCYCSFMWCQDSITYIYCQINNECSKSNFWLVHVCITETQHVWLSCLYLLSALNGHRDLCSVELGHPRISSFKTNYGRREYSVTGLGTQNSVTVELRHLDLITAYNKHPALGRLHKQRKAASVR